jgi:hypothetical protein
MASGLKSPDEDRHLVHLLNTKPDGFSQGSLIRSLVFCCVLCFISGAKVQAMEMVLLFGQLQDNVTNLYPQTRTRLILGHLRRFQVDEVGVIVRTRDLRKASIRDKLKVWGESGHLLINQGHHYHLLSRPDERRYQLDLLRGHQQLQTMTGYKGHTLLRELEYSASQETRKNLENFVTARGLAPVYVDLRVDDSEFNYLYQQAISRRRQQDMGRLQDAWVEHLWPELVDAWYQQLVLGGGPLVVVLEEHDLTAYFLPGLLERMQSVGGRFVPPSEYFARAPLVKSPTNPGQPSAYLAQLLHIAPPRHQPLALGGGREWAELFMERIPDAMH